MCPSRDLAARVRYNPITIAIFKSRKKLEDENESESKLIAIFVYIFGVD